MQEIDFVIPWVDGSDPAWQKERCQFDPKAGSSNGTNDARFRDWDLLRYWFRAVEKYAPWVHRIYFVTWGHLPKWLNTDNEKLVIVNHREYMPAEYLPTFNANTIELNFHRIPGLAEQFVYFNDDMFLGKPVQPEDFFRDGKPRDAFILDAINFSPNTAGHYIANDMELINKYFTPRQVLKKLAFSQVYNLSYKPRNLYRTLALRQWPWFTGLYADHSATSFLKSTYEELWEKEPETLHKTCMDKFRTKNNVNQWLFKYWQLVTGNFVPRGIDFSGVYHLKAEVCPELLQAIEDQRYGIVCINDTEETRNVEAHKAAIKKAFEKHLSQTSSFEKA